MSEEKTKTGREKLTGLLQLIAVIVFVGLAVVYSQAPDESATQSTYGQVNASKSAAPLVSVVRPQLNTHSISISGNGSVTIRAYVDLAPQVSGVVASISPALRAGGTFKANEILVSIDTNDFKLRLKQAQVKQRHLV